MNTKTPEDDIMVIQRLIYIQKGIAWLQNFKKKIYAIHIPENLEIQPIQRALEQNRKVQCEVKYKNKEATITQFHISPSKSKNRTKDEARILKEQKEEYLLGGDY